MYQEISQLLMYGDIEENEDGGSINGLDFGF